MPKIFEKEEKNNNNIKIKKSIKIAIITITVKMLLIVLIPILILMSISAFWNELQKKVVTQVSGVIRETNSKDVLKVEPDNRQYAIDEEFLDTINDTLEDTNQAVKVDDELLEKFYRAEVITSFPDLRKRDKIGTKSVDGTLQGCVQFNRVFSDGTQTILEYMDYDSFRTELAKFGCYLPDSDGNTVSQEKIYETEQEVNEKYNSIKTYFTLDEEYNLIIATKNTNTTQLTYSDYAKEEGKTDENTYSYTVEYKKLNYQTSIEKYSMPIEFLLIMLQISQNPGYCEAIVDLVNDTKIVLEIQDSEQTTKIVEKYDYVADFEMERKVNYEEPEPETEPEPEPEPDTNTEVPNENTTGGNTTGGTGGGGGYTNPDRPVRPSPDIHVTAPMSYNSQNYTVQLLTSISPDIKFEQDVEGGGTNTSNNQAVVNNTYKKDKNMDAPYSTRIDTMVQDNINICVKYVDNWILETSIEQNILQDNNPEEVSTTNLEDDTGFSEVKDYHNLLSTLPEATLPEGAIVTSTEDTLKEKQTGKEQQVSIQVQKVTFVPETPNTVKKEEKFLSLLKVEESTKVFNKQDIKKNTVLIKYEDSQGRITSPEENIFIFKARMFELLASYQKTQSFEEIMRYLLYVYTGVSYGVDTLDFSMYDAGSFTSVYGGTSGISGIQGQIYDFLLSKGMSSVGAAAVLGNMQRESSFVTDVVNSSNHCGLCQWGGGRFESLKEKANSMGQTWDSLEVQLEFLWQELETGYSPVKDELMNATDLYTAVDYFTRHYEVCGSYDTEVQIRYEYAQYWYEQFENRTQINHSSVEDIQKYNLNVYKGYIEYKQTDYKVTPPFYQATSSPAGTIKDKGCMPTSISIILSGMGVTNGGGSAYTPETLISSGTIAHINGGSSTAGNAKNTFRKCGLNASNLKYTSSSGAQNEILSNLNVGNAILIHASRGYYTTEGHFMTLIDGDIQGKQVYLSNPSSRTKTGWVSLEQLINPRMGNVDWYMVVSR